MDPRGYGVEADQSVSVLVPELEAQGAQPVPERELGDFHCAPSGGLGACFIVERVQRTRFLLERQVAHEKQRADDLLRNILPAPVAAQLVAGSSSSFVQRYDDARAHGSSTADGTPATAM